MLSPCAQTGRPSLWRWWSPTRVPSCLVRLDAGMGTVSSPSLAHVRHCLSSVCWPHIQSNPPHDTTGGGHYPRMFSVHVCACAFHCCTALTTFGYHEVTPIVRKEGRERKLPTFSICCSTCWQLYDQLHQLACSDSLLHVCLVALQLCRSPEQAQDPYWDVMCKMALDACVKQPHILSSQGFPSAMAKDLPVRDLFGESE